MYTLAIAASSLLIAWGCATPAPPKIATPRDRLSIQLGIPPKELAQIEGMIMRKEEKFVLGFFKMDDGTITAHMANHQAASSGRFYSFRKEGDLWVEFNSSAWRRPE